MTHRDYLWCAVNLVLDGEEELSRLCPACRAVPRLGWGVGGPGGQ